MEKKKVLEDLQKRFAESILSVTEQFGDDIILVRKGAILGIMEYLKNDPYSFTMLLDLTCVDYIGDKERYEMVYHLFSLSNKLRLRIKSRLTERDSRIDYPLRKQQPKIRLRH
jgi:NADH-quinone oxidoreductase subunit C